MLPERGSFNTSSGPPSCPRTSRSPDRGSAPAASGGSRIPCGTTGAIRSGPFVLQHVAPGFVSSCDDYNRAGSNGSNHGESREAFSDRFPFEHQPDRNLKSLETLEHQGPYLHVSPVRLDVPTIAESHAPSSVAAGGLGSGTDLAYLSHQKFSRPSWRRSAHTELQ